jgi:hypothetical protein
MLKRLDAEKSDRRSYKTGQSNQRENRPEVCATGGKESKANKKGEQTPTLFAVCSHAQRSSAFGDSGS